MSDIFSGRYELPLAAPADDFEYEPTRAPRRGGGIARKLLLVGLALAVGLLAPYLVERVQYASTRGALRAKAEVAEETLSKLAVDAELVKLSDTSRAFRLVAQRVEPCVVHIDTEQFAPPRDAAFEFGEPFQRGPRVNPARGQGSGVIIDPAGYILTNYHVVENASSINVRLTDQRQTTAQIIGFDELTDLAVLKIGLGDLVAAQWGDSRALEVGDWVLAVGNPYGLDRTVTSGIISAKHRDGVVGHGPHKNFLQTDAAVNPGNSGGPLLNIQGEVVGITTAIVGRAYQGISFAVPSEIAKDVFERLKSEGSITRGWLGVELADLTPALQQQLGIGDVKGALISGVRANTPAASAGLAAGDVVIEWNGEPVHDRNDLMLRVAAETVGAKATLKLLREAQEVQIPVTIGRRPSLDELRANP